MLTVRYDGLIAPLIESVKELAIDNDQKRARILVLEEELSAVTLRLEELERAISSLAR